MTARVLVWVGPDPERVEAAQAVLEADHLTARGTSTTAGYTLDWVLRTGPGWVTRDLSVRARGDGWSNSLDLGRDDRGSWLALRTAGDGPAERLDVTGLDGALDCDLALCPFTNTMPVLRHGLLDAARADRSSSVDLVMAWVDVPELTVEASPQRYTAIGPAPGGGAMVGFTSDDFEATIEFDDDGFVREYPELATRLR